MTIFRDEFDVRFIVMFGVLLFIKCFCWIGGSRVEFMETSPPDNPTLFHIRLASSLVLLLSACTAMLWHSVASVLERGRPNMMVMFAFEFAILLITSLGITGRYGLSLVEKYILKREAARRIAARVVEREDARRRHAERTAEVERRRAQGDIVDDVPELEEEDEDEEELDVGGWEEKGTWVFYLELVTGGLPILVDFLLGWSNGATQICLNSSRISRSFRLFSDTTVFRCISSAMFTLPSARSLLAFGTLSVTVGQPLI